MRVKMDYGKTGREVEVPDGNLLAVLGITPAPPIADADTAIRRALESPIGTGPLSELAKGKRTACLVICDITRPVPNETLLLPMLSVLEASGVPREGIAILIATGTHRPNLGDELVALVGETIASRYRCINHECKDTDMMTNLGVSPNGVPVKLNRLYVEAELKISVGLIEPHFMAGYSGGRKLIMPGIAAFETVQAWHCPRFLEHPKAIMGVLEGNPVHTENMAIAKMAPQDFILDVTLDEQNRITGVYAGHMEAAWLEGVAFAAQHVRAGVSELADIVLTSGAGYPLDGTFYQTVKGMVGALPAVKKGGTIIVVSACPEGIGSPDFTATLLGAGDLVSFVAHISEPGVFLPEEWQVEELAKASRQAEIVMVTDGIAPDLLSRCFVEAAVSAEAALVRAFEKHGKDATLTVIPRGPYVIPFVEAQD